MYKEIKSVTIYCASSQSIPKVYFDAAEKLAELLADQGIKLIYGGGSKGLMGKIADTYLSRNAPIKGIIPRFMKEVEWAHPGVTEMVITETMAERKALLMQTDAIITLAGGCGTFEELLEVISLKRLGKFTKPIVILNTQKYYDPLKQLLENAVAERFMNQEHLAMWNFVDHPEEILQSIRNAEDWSEEAIHFAESKNK